MCKKLAIKGHSTRSKEVIRLLEMMGGINDEGHSGTNSWKDEYYFLDNGYIRAYDWCDGIKFTLEEFLYKYPFKVGDKVILDEIPCTITWMCWECNNVYYYVESDIIKKKVTAEKLKPYKEPNMNKKLAIKGHPTRGEEVIKLLEMFGGSAASSKGFMESYCYYISEDTATKYISWDYIGPEEIDKYEIFTLEEFLEKYPFKVGDFVCIPEYESEVRICKMKWCKFGYVEYLVYRNDDEEWYTANELLEYNAEFLVDKEYGENVGEMSKNITLNHLYKEGVKNSLLSQLIEHIKTTPKEELEREFNELNKLNEIGPSVEEYIAFCESINKNPEYPTTYEECYDEGNTELHFIYVDKDERDLYESFIQLIRCRNAYWRIYGKQMGLGKPWEPDLENEGLYCVQNYNKQIIKSKTNTAFNKILIFPTEEMRDSFYEYFKDLIDRCKELL